METVQVLHRVDVDLTATYIHWVRQNIIRLLKDYSLPDSEEGVDHSLLHCLMYGNIRTRQPTIHNTQYGATIQLQRIATYNISPTN